MWKGKIMKKPLTGLLPYIKVLNTLGVAKPVKFVGISANVIVEDFKSTMQQVMEDVKAKKIKAKTIPIELKKYYIDNFIEDPTSIIEDNDEFSILKPDECPDIDSLEALAQVAPLPDFEESDEEALLKETKKTVFQKLEIGEVKVIIRLGNCPDVHLNKGFSYFDLVSSFRKVGVTDADFIDYVIVKNLKESGIIPKVIE